MKNSARLAKLEAELSDHLIWQAAQRAAAEAGLDAVEVFREAKEILRRYMHLAVPDSNGELDMEPVLRAMAEDERLEYGEVEDISHQSNDGRDPRMPRTG